MLGILDSISRMICSKVCNIFRECNADIDPVNIEACHRLKSNRWPKKFIAKLAKRKVASKILKGKKKLKNYQPDLEGFSTQYRCLLINESFSSNYRFLWSTCKKLWSKKSIASFWILNGSIRIKRK